ncbi:MAG: nucleoside monophosphate kinase [Chlamydiales bacterium]|nr:nucleoside monophosphate kinase [Chlamydiales bacterium]
MSTSSLIPQKSICFIEYQKTFLLLHEHSDTSESWRIPGGRVLELEDYFQAIIRLVRKQTTIDFEEINFTYCCKIPSTDQRDPILHVFHSVMQNNPIEGLSGAETQIEWVGHDYMEHTLSSIRYKEAFQSACSKEDPSNLKKSSLESRLVINLLGTVGVGKGTQGKLLSEQYNIPTLSMGDLYRNECRANTPIGEVILYHDQISSPTRFADEIPYGLLLKKMADPDCKKGFILDGFPRSETQSTVYNDGLLRPDDIHIPIYLSVDESDILDRLKHRYICSNCEIQIRREDSLTKEGCCPHCEGMLIKRKEDISSRELMQRLQFFKEHIPQILSIMTKRNRVIVIHAKSSSTPQEIFQRILQVVETLRIA